MGHRERKRERESTLRGREIKRERERERTLGGRERQTET